MLYTLNCTGLEVDSGGPASVETKRKLQEVYERLKKNWEWAWETTAEEDVRRAGELLEKACRSGAS